MSDVMVGAGIGILATELGYYLADLIFKERGLRVAEMMTIHDRSRHPSFVAFNIGMTVVPGRYAPWADMRTELFSGPSVGAEGAWFASPYWGVGGRVAVTNLRVAVNGVSQRDNLEVGSILAGPQASYPVSLRWLVGGRLLAGYEGYKSCETDLRPLGDRGGFSFGAGFSTTYFATQNLGVRFATDYTCAPPLVRVSRERLHCLTLGISVCAMF